MAVAIALLLAGGAPALAQSGDGPEASAEAPDYAVDPLRMDCLGRPCGPFRILDLEARAGADVDSLAGLRLQLDDRVIAGFTWTEHERSWRLEGSRLQAQYREADGLREMDAAWLGARVDVRAGATERPEPDGGGWTARAGLGYRPGPRLRLGVEAEREVGVESPLALVPAPRIAVRVGALWQPGPRLEVDGGLGWARLRVGTGEDADRWSVDGAATWQTGRLLLRADGRYDETQGRFRRRNVSAGVGLDARVGMHLLLSGAIREAVELGVAERARSWTAGVTLHGRGYRFPRGGRAGDALERLALLAWDAGYGLTRAYDLEGLRSLRERMRLTRDPELDAAAAALYRAQLQDRRVPTIELLWDAARSEDVAVRVDGGRAAIAVPWPPSWPWRGGEERTRFLRLEVGYTEARFAGATREIGRRYALEAELNRELVLWAAWERRIRSPLELALGVEPQGGVRGGLRYAYGQ